VPSLALPLPTGLTMSFLQLDMSIPSKSRSSKIGFTLHHPFILKGNGGIFGGTTCSISRVAIARSKQLSHLI